MKRLVILAAALATAAPVAGNAADYAWPVLRVIDGDTLAVDASADMPPELAEVRRRSAARSAAAVTAPVPSARVRGTRDGGMGREALMVVHGGSWFVHLSSLSSVVETCELWRFTGARRCRGERRFDPAVRLTPPWTVPAARTRCRSPCPGR